MPNYAFKCYKCNAEFEYLLSVVQSDEIPSCPQCNSIKNVKKTFKPIPIRFNARDFSRTYRG